MIRKIDRIKMPKGYSFRVSSTYGLSKKISLLHNKEQIGYCNLAYEGQNPNDGRRVYRTHSDLRGSYHGKGLGTLMYALAIRWGLERGYKVRSSGYSSRAAKRVWNGQGLRKFFVIKKHIMKHYRQPVWYAYPKIK